MAIQQPTPKATNFKGQRKSKNRWFEKLMAIAALLNFGLVVFDWSYIPWRDFYFSRFPALTDWYGSRYKGIEPHRATTFYLQRVDALENQVAQTGLQSPEAVALLRELQTLSAEMVDENPFGEAGKLGTLERIKDRMRDRLDQDSSKQAFTTFWSQDYLTKAGWNNSITFFNHKIRPLIATNYYRHIGDNGDYIDRFWQIDLWFIGLFGAEFLVRTLYLSRRYKGVSWLDTIIWRGYDIPLLLPFWRWLRLIPVVIRLDQSNLVNFEPINRRIVRTAIASVAVELTEMVVLRIIDQTQELIRGGEVARWLLKPNNYIDLNSVDEVKEISGRLIAVLVYQVLPKVKPEIEALLHHSLTRVLDSSPIYAGLQHLPGVNTWSNQLTQQLVADVSQNAYQAITASLEDEVGAELVQRLVSNLGSVFKSEVQREDAVKEIQTLAVALLDEVKINYAQRIDKEELDSLRAKTKRIYEITQSPRR
jgi:hypothetical protein